MYPNLDNEYVNLISHEDASGSSSPSFGASSSSPPIFHYNEDIMEVIMTPNYPWDDMHHHVYFLPLQIHYLYVLEFKDFIHGEVNWFKIPIPTPVEEWNTANISPNIKINISNKPGLEQNIIFGA